MKRFHEIEAGKAVNEAEQEVLDYWREEKIPARSVTERKGFPRFIFYEGPPTANGKPGIHHVLARTLKDTVCRYKTMRGFQIHRKAGWDTHGLPVEIEVEKQLGLGSRQDIEAYGIEAFNAKCRESVFAYEQEWRRMTERIGYWLDMDHPYITLDNDYIETVWWILKRYFDEGLIYEGHKILPYCARCGTPLASHEVSQGYQEETVDSIYVKMKVKGREKEYFLVWTTTPWTLPSNVALAVHPDYTYARARRPSDDAVYILARERMEAVLGEEAELLEEVKGEALTGTAYEQLIPFVSLGENALQVYAADFVSTGEGTGIVHIAPAFGEDDYRLGREYDLPFVQPVDGEGKFTAEINPWAGRFVRDADPEITGYLKDESKLFRIEQLTHTYPFCWRCDTPLLYYGRKSWYIATTKYKDRLIANNRKVKWYPGHVGEGRFGNWLENLVDWSLSRDRYWGTPLNIWKCEGCSRTTAVGSRRELAERAAGQVDPAEIELHRPFIDRVYLQCECGRLMERTPEVIDCWFDSGSMPYAQWHYPFAHKDDFDRLFPADFICEGIDQTRGWFYALLAISTFLFDKPAFKSVMVNDLVLDKNGQKMSKSRGNAVEPDEMIRRYGADATRWYLLAVSPPWTPTRFDEDGVREVSARFFGTLRNVYAFFALYANIDDADPESYAVSVSEREEIDRWIISRLNTLTGRVRVEMEAFELTRAVREIQSFVIDEVSNWYVRRTRERFWGAEMDRGKKAVYRTLWEVLVTVAKLMAPFTPFLAEQIYRNLKQGEGKKASVHLELYPEADQGLVDAKLERVMELVINLVSLGRAARNRVQIKVRQPVPALIIDAAHRELLGPVEALVREELNVKKLAYTAGSGTFLSHTVKPDFAVLGPRYGKLLKEIGAALDGLDPETLLETLRREGKLSLTVGGSPVTLAEDDLVVRMEEKEGYAVEKGPETFIVLDTRLTEELIREGLAREVVSKVQNMRKEAGLELTDRIELEYSGGDELAAAMDEYGEYVARETLSLSVIRRETPGDGFKNWNLNGRPAALKVKRAR